MKNMRKLFAMVLAVMLVMSLATTAFAATNGTITINNSDTVTVAGKTFNAYKILDLELVTYEANGQSTTGYVYTVPAGLEDFYAGEFTLDKTAGDFDYEVTQKIATMANNSDALYAFLAKALAAAKAANITPATATGAEGATSVTISNLPLGYYVIEDTGATKPVSALMLDSTNPDVTIKLKTDKPGLEKNIDGDKDTDETTNGKVEYNNGAIGDVVPFILETKVPDMTGYTNYWFVVNDTLSKGLTFNNDVAIVIGEGTGAKTLVKDTDFTVTSSKDDTSGETTFEIVFKNFIQYKDNPLTADVKEGLEGKKITITYSATINAECEIGVTGNPNEAYLIYDNDPNDDSDGDKPGPQDPHGETPKDYTRTYVTEINIEKVDQAGRRLEGAEFELTGTKLNTVLVTKEVFTEDANGSYWKLTDGTYTTDDPNAEGMDQTKYESITVKYKKETKTETITKGTDVKYVATVGSDGMLKFTGLAAGTYTITEIKAPDGYNLLDAPITVTIGCTIPTGEAAATNNDCTWTYAWNGGAAGNNYSIEIVNQAGTELPETGGMGTTLFYIIGGILVVGSAVLLVTKKRMGAEG